MKNNNASYTNDFTYGRERVKKFMIAAAVSCAVSLFLPQYSAIQLGLMALTVLSFATAVVIVFKYCRCPSCGKVIFLGVLRVTACPRCRRSLTTGKKIKKSR